MDVGIKRAAEALNQRHRPGVCFGPGQSRLVDEMRLDRPVDDPQHPAHRLGVAGEQKAQLIGNAQYPLAHRPPRQDLIDQQCGTFHRAPGTTAGAETAPLTAERDTRLLHLFGPFRRGAVA